MNSYVFSWKRGGIFFCFLSQSRRYPSAQTDCLDRPCLLKHLSRLFWLRGRGSDWGGGLSLQGFSEYFRRFFSPRIICLFLSRIFCQRQTNFAGCWNHNASLESERAPQDGDGHKTTILHIGKRILTSGNRQVFTCRALIVHTYTLLFRGYSVRTTLTEGHEHVTEKHLILAN